MYACLQTDANDDNQMDVAGSENQFDVNMVEQDYVVRDMSDKENEHNTENTNVNAHRSSMIIRYNLFSC